MSDNGNPTVQDVALKLTDEESKSIANLHRQAQAMVHQIGQLEVRKAQTMTELQSVEMAAKAIMDNVAVRLGIEPGTPWQITPDGNVVLLDPKTGQPVGTPPVRVVPAPAPQQ